MFVEVVGRVSGVGGGRARVGLVLLLSRWLSSCVDWKWIGRKCHPGLCWFEFSLERENWVLTSAYRQRSEKSQQEFKEILQ